MEKKIRSISIASTIDEKLIEDSRGRGLTISANVARILYDYFQGLPTQSPINVLSSVKRK
tara:strand:- start:903 stop:1082 length:180 start_codon:yes stop_codon:yes gene_type:complete